MPRHTILPHHHRSYLSMFKILKILTIFWKLKRFREKIEHCSYCLKMCSCKIDKNRTLLRSRRAPNTCDIELLTDTILKYTVIFSLLHVNWTISVQKSVWWSDSDRWTYRSILSTGALFPLVKSYPFDDGLDAHQQPYSRKLSASWIEFDICIASDSSVII